METENCGDADVAAIHSKYVVVWVNESFDLSDLSWSLRGYTPYQWGWGRSMETGMSLASELAAVPAKVPGSVQSALRLAGLLPDWNVGLNARDCEWVEHRHWAFEASIPDPWLTPGKTFRLRCMGLDGPGWLLVNGQEVARFENAFIPHCFDLTKYFREQNNRIQIVFDCPPRWLGQLGFTSQMVQWKPRFNYTWDWIPRLVQIGVWDAITLEVSDGQEIGDVVCRTGVNRLHVQAASGCMRLTLSHGSRILRTGDFEGQVTWNDLPVDSWWPNGHGAQPLYNLKLQLLNAAGEQSDVSNMTVGFKSIDWQPCEGAPVGADPWICQVNGKPIFLQGVNWTPILPNFADVTADQYRRQLTSYRDMGCNVMRVWGGAVLEKQIFYNLCDELGLLVWQEFPLSSSGLENWPPEDPQAIEDLVAIAASYIRRRQHHACLLLWCGGNELQGALDGNKTGIGKPVDCSHPLMARLQQLIQLNDPGRRFLPSSASGPRFTADANDFGKGLHWDVHGPWNVSKPNYWENDDALFRSEVGVPGASSVEIIREFSGGLPELPASLDNPLWRRTSWWIQWPDFLSEKGREPENLEEFVAWSQQRQAAELSRAVRACKNRFPRCGGVVLWMGHDCFPCTSNTAIFDVHGRPKPAAIAVGEVFRE